MLNLHLFLEALRVNGELQNGALSLSRSQFNLLKIVIFGNMTIWIWQLFWKFNKYDNLQYDNYFEHMKIWQFAIWQLFRKNCHIWISKYDKKKNLCTRPQRLSICKYMYMLYDVSCMSYHRFFFVSYFQIQIWQFFRNNCHIANCHISICSKLLSYYGLSYFQIFSKNCHIQIVIFQIWQFQNTFGECKMEGLKKSVKRFSQGVARQLYFMKKTIYNK